LCFSDFPLIKEREIDEKKPYSFISLYFGFAWVVKVEKLTMVPQGDKLYLCHPPGKIFVISINTVSAFDCFRDCSCCYFKTTALVCTFFFYLIQMGAER
jgi:hypothetical protein